MNVHILLQFPVVLFFYLVSSSSIRFKYSFSNSIQFKLELDKLDKSNFI